MRIPGLRLIGINLVRTGLINTRTNQNGWQANWMWAEKDNLSKLLGTSFGLNLNTPDVDQFLYHKISKKLKYWSSMKLSLAGRVIICNHVLLSTLWFFITMWGDQTKYSWKLGEPSVTICGHARNNTHELELAGEYIVWRRKMEDLA